MHWHRLWSTCEVNSGKYINISQFYTFVYKMEFFSGCLSGNLWKIGLILWLQFHNKGMTSHFEVKSQTDRLVASSQNYNGFNVSPADIMFWSPERKSGSFFREKMVSSDTSAPSHSCRDRQIDRQTGPQLSLWMIEHDGFSAAFLWRMVYFHWKHNCLWQEFWKRFYPKHCQKSILKHDRPLQVS